MRQQNDQRGSEQLLASLKRKELPSARRVDDNVGCRRAGDLRLIPRTAALLVGEAVHHDHRAVGRKRVDDRTYHRGRDHGRGSDSGRRRNRVIVVIAAAAITAPAVDINVDVDILSLLNVHVLVYIHIAPGRAANIAGFHR